MRRTTIWLKSIQIRQLKSLARETGAPASALIRVAIDELIKRRKAEKAKKAVRDAERQMEKDTEVGAAKG